jgi:hypothetical protein
MAPDADPLAALAGSPPRRRGPFSRDPCERSSPRSIGTQLGPSYAICEAFEVGDTGLERGAIRQVAQLRQMACPEALWDGLGSHGFGTRGTTRI